MHRPEQLKGVTMSPLVCSFSQNPADKTGEKGMTLVELLVSMTIGIILITLTFGFFSTQTNSLNENRQTAEMQQELRWAMQYVSDHLRLAGNAAPSTSGWQVIENFDGSGNASDSLSVLGSYRSLVVNTTQTMGNEGSQIKCSSVEGINEGDLIVISDGTFSELFMVTNIQGDHLYHGASPPWNDTNKLLHSYTGGSTITSVSYYSFFIRTDDQGHPNLMVKTQAYPPQILGGDIENFQIRFKMKSGSWQNTVAASEVYDIRQIEITLRARSPQPLRNYLDPVYGDAYKRVELKSMVIPKNLIVI
ncbi:MAG: prepilin-type N-terminal cleavage/methylation domain-containing protein [Candidatus Latescibacter sp.]|nr:prepilin-type N-terminal cleavage/methylation domain-containing protein [Candidatus Latescibacter sp.]